MAKINKRHKLEGFGGKVGENLRLSTRSDGKVHVGTHDDASAAGRFPHWKVFRDAVAYARKMQSHEVYVESAEKIHDTPFHVATADFLHPPEITEIDLHEYSGHPGDKIHIHAVDDVEVAQVGILITDEDNHLIEMGMATPSGQFRWTYVARFKAPGHHVRVIVDAADLPGHLDEARAEKDI